MPKKYSDLERENIRKDLFKEAKKALYKNDLDSITIDELVKRVQIPKGTFYLFYPNKESLFFDYFVTFKKQSEEKYLNRLQELDENHIVTSLTTVFFEYIMDIYKSGVYKMYSEEVMMRVLRKIPDEVKKNDNSREESYIYEMMSYFAIDDKNDIEGFRSALKAIIITLSHSDEIENIEATIKLLIRGLILQLVE